MDITKRPQLVPYKTKLSVLQTVLQAVKVFTQSILKSECTRDLRTQEFWTRLSNAIVYTEAHLYLFKTSSDPDIHNLVECILSCLNDFIVVEVRSGSATTPEDHFLARYHNLFSLSKNLSVDSLILTQQSIVAAVPLQKSDIQLEQLKTRLDEWLELLETLCPSDDNSFLDTGSSAGPSGRLATQSLVDASVFTRKVYEILQRHCRADCDQHDGHEACLVLATYLDLVETQGYEYVDLAFSVGGTVTWEEVRVNVTPSRKTTSFVADSETHPEQELPEWWEEDPELIQFLCSELGNTSQKMLATLRCQNWLEIASQELYKHGSTKRHFLPYAAYRLVDFSEQLSSDMRDYSKLTLAVLLSYSLYHLYQGPWLSDRWPRRDIKLLQGGDTTFLRPLLKVSVPFRTEEVGIHKSRRSRIHKFPVLLGFAITLIEIHEGRSLKSILELNEEVSEDIEELCLAAGQAFKMCQRSLRDNTNYKKVIKSCLNVNFELSDPISCTTDELRSQIYIKIVQPLEIELRESFQDFNPLQNIDLKSCFTNFLTGQIESETVNLLAIVPTHRADKNASDNSWDNVPQALRFSRVPQTALGLRGEVADLPENLHSYAEVDQWFKNLAFIRQSHHLQNGASVPIRIAVLDTGLDRKHSLIRAYKSRIKAISSFIDNEDSSNEDSSNEDDMSGDETGHGTHVAHTILKLVPHAEIYIAKVAKTRALEDRHTKSVTKAIRKAAEEWKVHMINMSFGFVGATSIIEQELEDTKNILIFAATGNSGGGVPVSYPASRYDVFGIYSTDSQGNKSDFISAPYGWNNFSALGEHVESAWPVRQVTQQSSLTARKSGTSMATAVALSIAALLIEWCDVHMASNPPPINPKHCSGMNKLLTKIAVERDPGYLFIDPVAYFEANTVEEVRSDFFKSLK